MDNIKKFTNEVKLVVGGAAYTGALGGLACFYANTPASYLGRSVGARFSVLEKQLNVRIVGISFDAEPSVPTCFYKIKDLDTGEVRTVQIV